MTILFLCTWERISSAQTKGASLLWCSLRATSAETLNVAHRRAKHVLPSILRLQTLCIKFYQLERSMFRYLVMERLSWRFVTKRSDHAQSYMVSISFHLRTLSIGFLSDVSNGRCRGHSLSISVITQCMQKVSHLYAMFP